MPSVPITVVAALEKNDLTEIRNSVSFQKGQNELLFHSLRKCRKTAAGGRERVVLERIRAGKKHEQPQRGGESHWQNKGESHFEIAAVYQYG